MRTGEELMRTGEELMRTGEELMRIGEELMRTGEEQMRIGEELMRTGEAQMRIGEEQGRSTFRLQSALPGGRHCGFLLFRTQKNDEMNCHHAETGNREAERGMTKNRIFVRFYLNYRCPLGMPSRRGGFRAPKPYS